MSYEIFIQPSEDPDDDRVLSEESLQPLLLNLLPQASVVDRGVIQFGWEDYGRPTETAYFAPEGQAAGSIMIHRPSEETIALMELLCRERGWFLVDGDGPVEADPFWSSLDSYLLTRQPFPAEEIGAPGWADRARRYVSEIYGEQLEPCAADELAEAEQRVGPLPEVLRIFLTQLGNCGQVRAAELVEMSETENFSLIPPDQQQQLGALIGTSGSWCLDPQRELVTVADASANSLDFGERARRESLREFLAEQLDEF